MRKLVCISLVSVVLFLGGCQNLQGMGGNDATLRGKQEHTTYRPSGGTNSILEMEHFADRDPKRAEFGYVRHEKAQVQAMNREPIAGYFDRDQLAEYITKMSLYVPGVQDVGTLVTHKHVLISYHADTENRVETAEQVKKSAEYLVPRFYDVYVSDEPEMMQNIERFRSMSTLSPNVDEVIEYTIHEMQQTNPYIAEPRNTPERRSENPSMPQDRDLTNAPTM